MLSLPTGGAPARGFDPLIGVDPATGAATMSVPVHTTPARGTGPRLTLEYAAGGGNGPFGPGWTLAPQAIGRMTNRGVPRYDSTDTFTLTGIGRLTPALDAATGRPDRRTLDGWSVTTYQAVDDGALPLVERWAGEHGEHWRVVSNDGTTTVFGRGDAARVRDPDDPRRVFQWLAEESVDAHGNAMRFTYKAEDGAAVREEVFERGRVRTAYRYPERIEYGSTPHGHAYEVVFDYGEHDVDGPDPYTPTRPWPERADPFSGYAAGFEIRTYRLCRGVLVFHRLPELGGRPSLVAATRFGYREDPHGSLLTSVSLTGFGPETQQASLPPLRFTYTDYAPDPVPRFEPLRIDGAPAAPGYLARGGFQPADLDGVGLPGLLHSAGNAAVYYPPRGEGRYGAPEPLPSVPDTDGLAAPDLSVSDLDGDGGLQLLVLTRAAAGCFTRRDGTWAPFRPLHSVPTMLAAPRGELADLDGDGRAELVFVGRDSVVYHPSLGTAGFGPALARPRPKDFPAAGDGGAAGFVTFAGAFGDGLAHRIEVRDGAVTVWPSLGHGRFAAAVRLAGAPRLPDGLTAADVHLADLDGTGTADLVLAFPDHLRVYRNRSGNGFGAPFTVPLPVTLGRLDQLSFADVRGTGTTAIVVSRMAPTVEHRFTDLCRGQRPNLLRGADNGTGGSCAIGYASSTRYRLADQRAGRPWSGRTPYPQQVVAELTAVDAVTGATLRCAYDYHDGWFDPVDRTFGGFGLVEATQTQQGVEPVRTRTWLHVGTSAGAAPARYWAGDPDAYPMPDCVLDPAVRAAGGDTVRQAFRALRGRLLRTEVFGADPVPYAVTASTYRVRLRRAATASGPGSFLVEPREHIEYAYEREPADPRVRHSMVLESTLGDPGPADTYRELTVSVDYPRRPRAAGDDRDVPEQRELRASAETAESSRVTDGFRRVGAPLERRTVDLGGLPAPAAAYFTFAELSTVVAAALATPIPYGTPFSGAAPQSRPATATRIRYWDAVQERPLPPGRVTAAALVHHRSEAAFSPEWLADVFGDRVTPAELTTAGYRQDPDGSWWRPGPVITYLDAAGFHLPARVDGQPDGPFLRATAGYDPLLLVRVSATRFVDPDTPLTEVAEVDYRVAASRQVTDANGVVRQVCYDPLGRVAATSVFKGGTGDGDLAGYRLRPPAPVDRVLADPGHYLQRAATYHGYDDTARPAAGVTLTRPGFVSDPGPAGLVEAQVAYADGFGRVTQRRTAAEGGRWIVSGSTARTISGLSTEDRLPWHGAGPGFGLDGAAPPHVSLRDPLGRPVHERTPKGFLGRTVHRPWRREVSDADDTVLESPYYVEFMAAYPPDPTPAQRAEKDALDKAARFAGTPTVSVLDVRGNPVRLVEDALGDVGADAFTAIAGDGSAALREDLIGRGYLADTGGRTAVTAAFRPYRPGFALRLDPAFQPYAEAVTDLLRTAVLTSVAGFDGQGRLVRAMDPRLHRCGVDSAAYAYPMGAAEPALAASADAGPRRLLADGRGRPVAEWDGRDVRTDRTFDGLDRPLTTVVAGRLAECMTYGEHRPDPSGANLNGRLYLVRDGSGTVCTPRYAITGEAVESQRRYTLDHTTAVDWSGDVPLDPEPYRTLLRYDARGRLVDRVTPDGLIMLLGYHVSGRLATVAGTDAGGTVTRYLTDAGYTAAGERARTVYGDGAVQVATHEETTGRLLDLVTTGRDGAVLQRVHHAYDPVGNVTWTGDHTPGLVFAAPQPEAVGDFRYDGIYRLLRATGLQHPGIDATTYATGFKQSLAAGLDDPAAVLVPYTETYTYDDAGNLLSVQHDASVSFRRATPVQPTSNRLAGTAYDGGGNPLSVTVDGPVALTWDDQGRLAHTSPARRPGGGSERTWFGYDAEGIRTRTVVERFDPAGGLVATVETRTIGGWSQERVDGAVAGSRLWLAPAGRPLVEVGPAVSFQVGDRLGSVSLELDGGTGGVTSFEAYFPYGGSTVVAGPSGPDKTDRFTGQTADDSTSLYRFPARYQAPWLGRFVEPDPSGPLDGLNLYAYTGGNPLTFVDPTGRGHEDPDPDQPSVQSITHSFAGGLYYALMNSLNHAFVLAPEALRQKFGGTPEERQIAAANAAARRDELKLIYVFGIPRLYGVDPDAYLPTEVSEFLQPTRWPLSTYDLPYYGSAMNDRVRAAVERPETYAATAGNIVGSALTVGSVLGVGRHLALRVLPAMLAWTVPGRIATVALSVTLAAIGRAAENDQVWAAYQRDLADQPWHTRNSQYYYDTYLHGARRTELFMQHQEQQTNANRPDDSTIFGIAAGLLVLRVLALRWTDPRRALRHTLGPIPYGTPVPFMLTGSPDPADRIPPARPALLVAPPANTLTRVDRYDRAQAGALTHHWSRSLPGRVRFPVAARFAGLAGLGGLGAAAVQAAASQLSNGHRNLSNK
ncbi:hypothetical protein GCM10010532_096960 [Dactylosporangium siamense]|uniref:Uncharacterized protein n=1 Tax=Dactylosporangium siamense TaxID=685454 RepID=A0A919PTL9_9ACTN|nr:hypothetical protein Dsi01nite_080280 [Dactylosporangium siamense]